MNLFIHDIEGAKVVRGDTLREPKFKDSKGLLRFDIVIANPPFSLKNWGADTWERDPFKRAFCGVPPVGNGDWAWIQHMLASAKKDTGRVGVVMPHGVLFRSQETAIRECVVTGDVLESVIGLPPDLFYSTTIPACLLILRTAKPKERQGSVLFIDAARAFVRGRSQNQMNDDQIASVVDAYRTGDGEVPTRLVPLSEIRDNGFDLNIGRYLQSTAAAGDGVPAALARLASAREEFRQADDRLVALLAEAGYA